MQIMKTRQGFSYFVSKIELQKLQLFDPTNPKMKIMKTRQGFSYLVRRINLPKRFLKNKKAQNMDLLDRRWGGRRRRVLPEFSPEGLHRHLAIRFRSTIGTRDPTSTLDGQGVDLPPDPA